MCIEGIPLSSKHILNAQVAIRAPCCRQWFDCAECHAETQDHRLRKTTEMIFMCKKCKKAFRKDMSNYEESDEYCPNCDNHYVRRVANGGLGRRLTATGAEGNRGEDTKGGYGCRGRGFANRCTVSLSVKKCEAAIAQLLFAA